MYTRNPTKKTAPRVAVLDQGATTWCSKSKLDEQDPQDAEDEWDEKKKTMERTKKKIIKKNGMLPGSPSLSTKYHIPTSFDI